MGGKKEYTPAPQVTTTTQKAEPWDVQQPYLQRGFAQAENLLNRPDLTNEQELAFQGIADRAMTGSPLLGQAQQQLQSTLGGDYLYGGEGFNAALDAATRRIMPGIQSQFERAGRTGSGLAQQAQTQAIADAFASQYQQERQNQLNAMLAAPGMAQQDYNDLQMLANVGAQRQAIPQQNLANYMAAVGGNYGGTTSGTNTQTMPTYYRQSPASGLASLAGYGIGTYFGGPVGGAIGSTAGGLLGGVF